MSRPQRIIPPLKGTFTEITNSVANGKGVPRLAPKEPRKDMANEREFERSSDSPPSQKTP
jgi:hypothetical protein